jgi:hypothetical protein
MEKKKKKKNQDLQEHLGMMKKFNKKTNLKTLFFIFWISILFFISCNSGKKSYSLNKIEEFNDFYTRFYSDSLFQISRIKFPLEFTELSDDGMHDVPAEKKEFFKMNKWRNLETLKKDTVIYEKNWIEERKKEIIRIDNSHYKECIYIPDSGYSDVRYFELVNNIWVLKSMYFTNI